MNQTRIDAVTRVLSRQIESSTSWHWDEPEQGVIICSSKHFGLIYIAWEALICIGLLVKVEDKNLMQEERDS